MISKAYKTLASKPVPEKQVSNVSIQPFSVKQEINLDIPVNESSGSFEEVLSEVDGNEGEPPVTPAVLDQKDQPLGDVTQDKVAKKDTSGPIVEQIELDKNFQEENLQKEISQKEEFQSNEERRSSVPRESTAAADNTILSEAASRTSRML